MTGDNPSSADNQQERPSVTAWLDRVPSDVGHYVAGFVEGEGSFNVPIRRVRGDRCLPWRISLSFNVSQMGRKLPQFLRSVFEVGTVRGRADGVFYFEVTRPVEIVERSSRSSGDSRYEERRSATLIDSSRSPHSSSQVRTSTLRASRRSSN
jgi:hypothetical protein